MTKIYLEKNPLNIIEKLYDKFMNIKNAATHIFLDEV